MEKRITFYKYQGTGNDFVMIDNRENVLSDADDQTIRFLCDRRFGIGGDGLILLENSTDTDFKMLYFNADGFQGTMCGNGGRCIVAFAKHLNIIAESTTFEAIDGLHYATVNEDVVSLQMQDVSAINVLEHHVFLDTGSPHHVQFEADILNFDINNIGKKIRDEVYGKVGSNVNFVKKVNDSTYKMRTYERGVEAETLACGTGATAVAIAMHKIENTSETTINLKVQGGDLQVSFQKNVDKYTHIYLKGKATQVFKGNITCTH